MPPCVSRFREGCHLSRPSPDSSCTGATIVPGVFHRRGKRIKSFHVAWRAACRLAGVPGRIPHDLRRTAARALRALGMSDRDIAELCGWETVAMVSRYLGRDPSGVADRLRLRLAESEARTRAGARRE